MICLFGQAILSPAITAASPDGGAQTCNVRSPIVVRVLKSRWDWDSGQNLQPNR